MRAINLPTDLLRAFVSVIDLGGYTRAADALGRTQPAISLQMKRLEELAGARLITHEGRELKLTEDGEALAVHARQILRLNDEAVARLKGRQAKGQLRIGLPTDFAVAFLQAALTMLQTELDSLSGEASSAGLETPGNPSRPQELHKPVSRG